MPISIWRWTALNDKKFENVRSGKSFWYKEIIFGIIFLVIVFVGSAQVDKKAAKSQINSTISYVKTQCSIYAKYNDATETKTLMRVIGNTQQVNRDIEFCDSELDVEALKKYASEQRLTGIIVMDENGKVEEECSSDELNSESLKKYIQKTAVLDVAKYPKKTYTAHIDFADGSYVNLAAQGRIDKTGVIVGFYHTNAEYAKNYNLTVQSLLSGYDTYRDGIIAITDGHKIVASNDESMVGKNVNENEIVRKLRNNGKIGKLVRVQNKFEGYYGSTDKSRDYYIYVYLPESTVFEIVPRNILYALAIYITLLIIIQLIKQSSERKYLVEQNKREKEYKEKLMESAKKAEQANTAKTEFLQRMSHDIRTPINGIRGMIELADYYSDDLQKQEECRKKVWDASGLLLELINEVLDMGKLESGEILLEEREFNLKKLLGDIVNVVEKQSKERQLEIVQCDYQIEHWNLIGSPIHIKRMLMNILSNAVKYNRYKGKIILDCREVSCIGNVALIEFICKDTGIGMSKEYQEHIFEPFTQEFNSARSSFGGTGLGMPITKSLVETMGGNIEFESEKNVGTTFRLKIPFKIDDCVHIEEPTEEEHNDSIEGVRVLVAEDNDLNMEITEFVLSSVGAVVIKASNGQEAIEIFEKSEVGEIDIILMDVMMPGVDGLAATRIIRSMSREDAKTIPIIAMTANAFSEDRLRAVEAGMNEHLAKPLESTVIIKTIAKYLKEE